MMRSPFNLRFTLGELALVALVAMLGLAALKMGDWLAAAVKLLGLLILITMAVVAVASDRHRRAFALGFLIGSLFYGFAVWQLGDNEFDAAKYGATGGWRGVNEFDPAKGELLTTRAMEPIYRAVATQSLRDASTGRPATPAEAEAASVAPGRAAAGQTIAQVGNRVFLVQESPTRREFMRTAHVLIGLLIGYAAGNLATVLYRRRTERQEDPTAESAS